MNKFDDIWDRVYSQNPDVMTRKIADEVLLIPIRGELADMQRIFMLNRVAEFVWKRMEGKRTLAAIRDAVVERFEVQGREAHDDIVQLVEKFSEFELIEEKGRQ